MEPVRRIVDGRRADTVQRLLDAAIEEIRAVAFHELSVRSVAKRADVSPATAYTYFSSKEHLVSSVVWARLQALPPARASSDDPDSADLADTVRGIARVFSEEPELSRACTTALLADDAEVRRLRDQIGKEIADRLAAALGTLPRTAANAITMSFVGGMLLAGVGYLAFDDLADRLTEIAAAVTPGAPAPAKRANRTSQKRR